MPFFIAADSVIYDAVSATAAAAALQVKASGQNHKIVGILEKKDVIFHQILDGTLSWTPFEILPNIVQQKTKGSAGEE